MKHSRSAVALLLPLVALASACTDDLPSIPGLDSSTGTPETTGVTTFPATTTGQSQPTTTASDATESGTTGGDTTTGEAGESSGSTSDAVDSSGGEESTSTSTGEVGESSSEGSSGTTEGVDDDTIYEIQDGTIPTGDPVDVRGVIVTGVSNNAFFAQEPAGGQYSGLFVFIAAVPTVSVGDEVDITGVATEFNDLTEIDASGGTVTATGVTGVVLAPDVVTLDELVAAVGEPWEGVYVRIEGMPLDVAALPGFDEFDVSVGGPSTRIDNYLYSVFDNAATYPNFGVGASFTAIQGPVNFTFGEYKIAPRDAADLEGYMEGPPP